MRRTCSVGGCKQPSKARGWCAIHYGRWQRHGDPLGGGEYAPDPALRIEEMRRIEAEARTAAIEAKRHLVSIVSEAPHGPGWLTAYMAAYRVEQRVRDEYVALMS